MVKKAITEYLPDELDPVDVSTDEQEVTITAYRGDERMSLWVTDNTMLTKVKRCMRANPDEWKLERVEWHKVGTVAGYEFSFPKKYLSFRTKTTSFELSEEERAERAKKLNEAKLKKSRGS